MLDGAIVEEGHGAAPPRLAPGCELLGEYQGSGYQEPPYLARRPDGQMLEISRLLHIVAAALGDGPHLDAVAASVGAQIGRPISADSVAYLVERKLRPLGLIASEDDGPSVPSVRPPLLGLSVRAGVIPAAAVRAITTVLLPLFRPVAVVTVLVGLLAVDAWLLLVEGTHVDLGEIGARPELLLLVLALTVVAGLFHELGHATASRYGGARPGVIGAGIYLIWPVFFNDLNDCHRLSRTGRLRSDLGGVYFNAVFVILLAGVYRVTGYAPLLVVIVLHHIAMLQQFLPFVRLDGYYIVSDLAGVPDLFARIGPFFSSFAPGRQPDPGTNTLNRRARRIVTAWVLVTVPLLAASLVVLALSAPAVVAGATRSAARATSAMIGAWHDGSPVGAVVPGLHLLVLAVPLVGLSVTMVRAIGAWCRSRFARGVARSVLQFGAPA